MLYIGFDLGDGESCISWSRDPLHHTPNIAPVSGRGSFFSAVGVLEGQTVVGSHALHIDAEDVHVCFKRHFLEHRPEVDRIFRDFVRGTLEELRKNPEIGALVDKPEEACFLVGCPAGWQIEDRKAYRELLMEAGMKNVKVVSESRAAFENAYHAREHVIDRELLRQSVLVIDIGSSTLDFAYVNGGNEYEIATMGNVMLGGGILDEMIVLHALSERQRKDPETTEEIRKLVEKEDAQKSRLMIAAREIKEEYFNNEETFLETNESLERTVKLFGNGRLYRVKLAVSPDIVENWLIERPHPLLEGQSFESRLKDSLFSAYEQSRRIREPQLVIVTGGPSRMKFFRELCLRQFSRSQVIFSEEPEYDIARGLVYIGDVDARMKLCIRDIRAYVEGDEVEKIVRDNIPDLIGRVVEPLTDTVLEDCVRPAFEDWKHGKTESLNQFQKDAEQRIRDFMNTTTMQTAIEESVKPWSRMILTSVDSDLEKISREHKVEFLLKRNQIFVHTGLSQTKGLFQINFISVIQTMISVILIAVTGMLCGGGGTVILVSGPLGVILGALVASVALVLGRQPIQQLIMAIHVPGPLRRLVSVDSICSERNARKISEDLRKSMLKDEEMAENLIGQIGKCIDDAIIDATDNVEKAMAE